MVNERGYLELDNGSKLYWFKEDSRNLGLALLIPFGPIYEKEEKRGITHLLEHLIFKSNHKYSAREINKIIELSGGDWNASTYWDSFVIQAEFLSQNYRKIFDIITAAVANRKFIKEEFEKEKEVVLTEIKEQMNDPLTKMYILAREAIYGEGDLSAPIGGYPETVSNISLDDVLELKEKTFLSEDVILVLVGGVNREIINESKKFLENLEEGSITKKRPSRGKGRNIHISMDTGDICYLAYGWELPVLDMYKLTMLEYLMVVGTTSLLYDTIREDKGLAYSFGSSSDMTHTTGYIAFGVEGFHCEKREIVRELLLETLSKVKSNDISEDLIIGKKNALAFGKEKYRHFYAERAEDTARKIYLGNIVESIEFAEKLIHSSWSDIGRVVGDGYFVEISPK